MSVWADRAFTLLSLMLSIGGILPLRQHFRKCCMEKHRILLLERKRYAPMPLVAVDFQIDDSHVPVDVEEFLREAKFRIRRFLSDDRNSTAGFVPSDHLSVYRVLRAISSGLQSSASLCEWGSGFGVVTCLATMLDMHGCGIEIESVLVESSRTLSSDFGLPAEFALGSFVPEGSEPHAAGAYEENNGEYSWLIQEADDGYEKLGRGLDSFDVVFAYPWPGEEYLVEYLFEKHASAGTNLVMYSDILALTVQQKVEAMSEVGKSA